MFKEEIAALKFSISQYVGTGMYMALFLIAIVYIFFKEEDKKIKTFIVAYTGLMFIIILNPLFYKIVSKVITIDIYWRMFWMLPMGLTIAYSVVKLINNANNKKEKYILLIASIGIIMISGKFIYTGEHYSATDNWYKVPTEAYQVTKIISEDDEDNKKAMVPESLVAYVRQIDANIVLEYGRNAHSYEHLKVLKEMHNGNVGEFASICKDDNCNYIVTEKSNKFDGNIEDYGYKLLKDTMNYNIYKLEE